jgi:hypothetical protein
MSPSSLIGLLGTAVVLSASAFAQPPKKPTPRAVKAPPAATAPEPELAPGQLEAASHVLTGAAACEFDQSVQLTAIDGQPGHFRLVFGKLSYTLVAQETTTGAVRLEDRKAGVVWLQIPAKSMLLNARVGQRMVDSCVHDRQRFAVAPANSSLGIEAAPLEPPATPATPAPTDPEPTVAPAPTDPESTASPATADPGPAPPPGPP